MPLEVWVGTSGYVYPEWVGRFYPPGASSRGMLAHYVQHFPLVELNFTFYRMPAARDLERLAQRTPDGFQFIVKLHRSLTHEDDLAGAGPFVEAVAPLRQAGRLLGLLCQYPQRFHDSSANRQRLEALAGRLTGLPLAVEFRHRSWDRPDLPAWLAGQGLHLVSVDVPAIPALFPTRLVQSSRLIYVRLHSRRAEAWYESGEDRYDYLYSDDELNEWLSALASHEGRADRALVLFNNCRRAQAAANAERVRQLLEQWGGPFRVVPPVARPGERQQLLF
jgi:uncharacterized protein YecE (DUF72 family)